MLYFVGYKKYFQRVIFRTAIKYHRWFPMRRKTKVYIVGHSIDPTDGDILEYICDHATTTVIYYHANDSLRRICENLVRILGKEKFIKYSGDEKIKFVSLYGE